MSEQDDPKLQDPTPPAEPEPEPDTGNEPAVPAGGSEPPADNPEVSGLKAAAAAERKKRQIAEQELHRLREQQPKPNGQDTTPALDPAQVESILEARERKQRVNQWVGSMSEAQERIEGVDLQEAFDSVGSTLALSPNAGGLAEAIRGSEKSWELIAHLHRNPDAMQKIMSMDPWAAAAEIGRLEGKVSSTPAKSVTGAPAPIRPTGSTVSGGTFDPDKASADEYAEHMRQQRGGDVWPR